MTDNEDLMKFFVDKLREEQEELDEAEDITRKTSPIFHALQKHDIINEVKLMLKLYGLDSDYRLAVYYLFRIAIEKCPPGSFVILDAEKAKALASQKQEDRINQMSTARLKTFCEIINSVNARELTKPLPEIVFNISSQALKDGKNTQVTRL